MKRIAAILVICMLTFSPAAFAAVSGSKSAPRPSTSTTVKPSAPSTAPSSSYKPSAPASSYGDTAPTGTVRTPQQTPQQPSQPGGFWRNAGLLGGGMFMGSMLSGMFGFGQMGFMASMMGVLFNILFVMAIIMGLKYVWARFRPAQDHSDNSRR